MRRLRLRTGASALFGAALLVMLVVFVPMRAALGWLEVADAGLSARRVTGSIWGGTLTEVRIGDLSLGDLSARLSPWPLLAGRARIDLAGPEGGLRGALGISRHALGVDDLSGPVATGSVFTPLPVTQLDLDDVTVRFEGDACVRAEGRVRATLGPAAGGVPLPTSVAGSARCEGGALLLSLASQPGTESIALSLRGDGRYRAELIVRPGDTDVQGRLEAAGFVGTAAGHRLSIEGRL